MKTKIKINLQGKSKTLQKFVEKNADKIDEVFWDSVQECYWLYTSNGYHTQAHAHECDDASCLHSIREDTVKEVIEQFKSIEKCSCQRCKTN